LKWHYSGYDPSGDQTQVRRDRSLCRSGEISGHTGKKYSSGMYVRLAFAVAAHLEPEILVVDEVLAVGDAAFQKSAWVRWGMWRRKGGQCCS